MKKIFFPLGIFVFSLSSCTKGTDVVFNPTPPRSNETPVSNFAFKQNGTAEIKSNFNLVSTVTDYPTEYGIEFTAAKKGVVYAVGFRMPQAGKYYVSLWDATTKTLLLRDSAEYDDPSKFSYKDFTVQSKEIAIEENKKYMASVYVPRSATGAPQFDYTLFQPGVYNWVPLTSGNITINSSYYKKEDFPTYPDVPVYHRDVLSGLVDIGFYATQY